MNNNTTPQTKRGTYFPFVEKDGIDRRHAILEISIEQNDDGMYQSEVFDTITGQIVWRSDFFLWEDQAYENADDVLIRLEAIYGFGSISLGGVSA